MAKRTKVKYSNDEFVIRGSYDSASTTRNNQNRWQYTDALSAVDANNANVRKTLISRARYEYDNNCYANGIINTIAKDTVGTGPRLQFNDPNDTLNQLEADWNAWVEETRYADKLLIMRICKAKDGECYALKVVNKNLKNDVKLYLQLFEAEQIGSHFNSKTQVDGVYTNKFNEAEAFNLFDNHPGQSISQKGRRVSSKDLIQYAYMTRPGQLRGIPEITPALELFVQLRAYTLSVLAASETAANLSGILYTSGSPDDETDEVPADTEFPIERNTLKALPFKWDMKQLKAEQPVTAYPDFKREILNEAARCLNVPYNVAAGNSSDYNFASGRLDFQEYWKTIDVEQEQIDLVINDNVFMSYATEWFIFNRLDIASHNLGHTWMYDGRPHVDPLKEANAETVELNNSTTNLSIQLAKRGRDWKKVLDQKLLEEAYEREQRAKLNLPIPENLENGFRPTAQFVDFDEDYK